MIQKESYLVYITVTNKAPAKEWNEYAPKRCPGALNFASVL